MTKKQTPLSFGFRHSFVILVSSFWILSRFIPTSSQAEQRGRYDAYHTPGLGYQRAEDRGRRRDRLVKVLRQKREVAAVDGAVVIEIALHPELAAARAEVGGHGVEIEGVDLEVQVRVTERCLRNLNG